MERQLEEERRALEHEESLLRRSLEVELRLRGEYSVEVQRLRDRLKLVEDRQRARSNAELTKTGYIYVTSNVGSFGPNVFKVGMTRRDDPSKRIAELSGASVPFRFDVHMMVSSNDAPRLEWELHKRLHRYE